MPKSSTIVSLLLALILIWGCGWPVITIGLPYCPALWYSTLRLIIATIIVFVAMGLTRQLIIPERKDWPLILSIGLFQIGAFVLLMTVGLEYVAPGRSAIIAYTSPFFVTPIAVFFFNEKLSGGKIAGLILGTAGIALLFSPWEMNWHDQHVILGNGLLLLAAICWSVVMLHTRYAIWHRPSHLLLPWQLLIGTIPNLLLAVWLEPHPVIHWQNPTFLFSLFYMAILATPIAYWIVIVVSRALPVITTSLALLAVPVAGLLSAAWLVGEPLTPSIMISMGLILSGLAFVALSQQNK
jgi:drug/metabolite transporter (DMT)-like permease